MKKWNKISSKTIFTHPRITLGEDRVRLPDGSEVSYLTFENVADFATVIGTTEDNKFILLRKFAYPINRPLWQFAEGLPNKNESLLAAAQRELTEETGYESQDVEQIVKILHYHRRSTASQVVFLAKKVRKSAKKLAKDLEESQIEVHFLSEDEVWSLIASGEMYQKHSLAAWSCYQAKKRQK